ncbi:MAG TPA: hypothetical protein VMK53_07600, partial [Gemmatimonadales bacterium]|nr:hypothetical protein [Gemmatimonadales bacterium]
MRTPRALLSLLLLAGLAVPVLAQPPAPAMDSRIFSGLSWRNVGPNRGGRSIAVAGTPSRTLEYYFGATGGGVWKTTDAGGSWAPVGDG